jgi:hypothetical protein
VSTYAEDRVTQQVAEDLMMVYMDRKILPEAVILVLCRSGNLRVQSRLAIRSDLGWSSLRAEFRVVELWKVPAETLFDFDDVGILRRFPMNLVQSSTTRNCANGPGSQALAETSRAFRKRLKDLQ